MSFSLRIISPKGLAYEGEVNEINIPLESGPIGILKGHTPYIAILKDKGILNFKEDGSSKIRYFVVYGGTMETKAGGDTMLLVEECKKASSLEEASKILEGEREPLLEEEETYIEKAVERL